LSLFLEGSVEMNQNAITEKVYKGRKPIYTNKTVLDKKSIPQIINETINLHLQNAKEIEYLENYYLGQQQIQQRIKLQRPDINNKITVNNAYAITRIINGIAYGNEIQVVPRKKEVTEQVLKFNEFSINEMKHKKGMEISNWQSIAGTAYMLVLPNILPDTNEPTKTYVLNPKTTYCVYSNTIAKTRMLGVTYQIINDSDGEFVECVYTIYSPTHTYTFSTKEEDLSIKVEEFEEFALEVPRLYSKKVPLVEFQNDMFSQGDWEMAISIIDGINLITSDRVNQFVQNVCYLYKMVDVDFEEGISDIYDVVKKGFVQLKSGNTINGKPQFDILEIPEESEGVKDLINYLQDKLELVVGVPNRQTRGGGGDTGSAVFLRNGLDDTHTRIALKHAFRISAEMEVVDLKLDITNGLGITSLKPYDIDIKITPIRHDNSQQTAQALQIYENIKFPKEDALSLLNLTQDPTTLATKWTKVQEEAKTKEAETLANATINKVAENVEDGKSTIEE
jgi:SPP1 family phage portal protein